MPMLFLFQQYQEVILTLLKMTKKTKMKGWGGFASAFFTLRASQSHYICFVVAHSRYTNTASWASSSQLQQSWLVNNPG
jgi:septal ring-binding cell division protein DamX